METENITSAALSENGGSNNGASVIDVVLDNFMAEVIEASSQSLVLLDFWADWCEPCKQLTPILERLAEQSGGALRLAKMDIDAHPEVAQQMQVQSIPAVFLFKDGAPIDGFLGAQSEAQVREFLAKHLNLDLVEAGASIEAAQAAFAAGDVAGATEIFSQILTATPDGQEQDEAALAGLAACHLAAGKNLEAQILLESCADSSHPEIIKLRAQISLANKTSEQNNDNAAAINKLVAELEAAPDNHQARFDLALAYHSSGGSAGKSVGEPSQIGEALAALLYIIDKQRDWNDGAAHKQLLELFAAYDNAGEEIGEIIASARRQLSSILFR